MTKTLDLLTAGEVAAQLRVGLETVRRLARIGEIPAAKVGAHWRFRQEDVAAYLKACRENRP